MAVAEAGHRNFANPAQADNGYDTGTALDPALKYAAPAIEQAPQIPAPVVVVGAGPVGIRAAQEVHRRDPRMPVVIYGDEPTEPYNRVRLSGFLIGELDWQSLTRDLQLPSSPEITTRYGCAVTAIDREQRCIRDATGHIQPYSSLILATGSRPHIPEIPGIRLHA